jgi:hypothetical protein
MRTIPSSKYPGQCVKCGTDIAVGSTVVYEKRVGVFCPPCAPTDTEEIRKYRQEGADRKADRLEGWAAKRRDAAAAVFKAGEPFTSDIAFNTQPGHIPFRARLIAREDRAMESLQKAASMEARASSLRHVVVAGDREKQRQAIRDEIRPLLAKGMKVHTAMYGDGVVKKVNKKTVTLEATGMSRTFTTNVDISWVTIPKAAADEKAVSS